MSSQSTFTYDAFISYRHADPDKKVAERLHRMLETFKIPASIAKSSGKKRMGRVFRDREELPTSSNLADNISQALKNSSYLIVICSPRTPQSKWVIKEIQDFKELHGHDKILALLIEGEPGESFPEPLRFIKKTETLPDGTIFETEVEVEPLAADIRASNEQEMFKKLRTEILRLLAPMLSCRFDDLRQRHRERLIRNILSLSISLSAFFLAFGTFSAYQALIINQKSQEVMLKSQEVIQKSEEIERKNQEILLQIQKTQIGQSRYLADISKNLYGQGDRYRAILVALEALPKDLLNPERPYVPEAEYALSRALGIYDFDNYYDGDIVLDHNKPVSFLKVSPDGKTLLTVSEDHFLNIWNIADGKRLAHIELDSAFLSDYKAEFVDNNSIVASVNDKIKCFDLDGTIKWQADENAYDLAVSPDSNLLAFQYVDRAGIIELSSGKVLTKISLKEFMDLEDFEHYVTCLKLNSNGDIAGFGTSFGIVYLFDTRNSELICKFNTGHANITDLDFSEENLAVTSAYWDFENDIMGKGKGHLDVFSLKNFKSILSMEFPYSGTDNVKFSPYNSSLVILTESEKLNVIDIGKGEIVHTFIHGSKITGYQIYDTFILSSSNDATVRFWILSGSGYEHTYFRITRPNPIYQMAAGGGKVAVTHPGSRKVLLLTVLENENTVRLSGHTSTVGEAEISSDGTRALTYDYQNGELILWDLNNRKILCATVLGERIKEAKLVDSYSKIMVALESGAVKLLSASDFSELSEIKCDSLKSLCFSADLSFVAIGTYSGNIPVYSTKDLSIINSFEYDYYDYLAITNNGRLFSVYKGIRLTDIKTGEIIIAHDDDNIESGSISPDGKKCALAYTDKSIKLFDADASLKETLTLETPLFNATHMLFSPDTSLLFVGFDDQSVSIYDLQNGIKMNTIDGENFAGRFSKALFSKDGKRFACIDEYGVAYIIDSHTQKMLAFINNLKDIDSEFDNILSSHHNDVITIPLYTTQMLLDEAKKQLKGRTLTDEERKELFIE